MTVNVSANRLIAMLDVLGLSKRINSSEGLVNTFKDYVEIIAHSRSEICREIPSGEPNNSPLDPAFEIFESVEFVFDNIVLVSKSLELVDVCRFICGVSNIMQYFAIQEMPLRGATALGDYLHGGNGSVFLSTAFKRLSAAEASQDWSGCFLLPEAENLVKSTLRTTVTLEPNQSFPLIQFNVPLKTGTVDALCINWVFGMSSQHLQELMVFMSCDASKYENTFRFVQAIGELPIRRFHLPSEFLPAVYATASHIGPGTSFRFWNADLQPERFGCTHFVFNSNKVESGQPFIGYDVEEELSKRMKARHWK